MGCRKARLMSPFAYIKLVAYLAIAAVIAALLGGIGYLGYRQGAMTVQARWDTAVRERKAGEEAALHAAAAAIAKIEVKSERIIQPLRTEIRTNTVYRDCRHSDDSLRNLNALIVGEVPLPAEGNPGSGLSLP